MLGFGLRLGGSGALPLSAATNHAPVVDNPIANQVAAVYYDFSLQFAADVFSDPEGGALTYTATLDDGSPLPGWLTFTAGTRAFAGTPMDGDDGTITVRVTATDPGGASAHDDFDIVVAAFVPAALFTAFWTTKGTGSLRGATSGTYTGPLDDESAIAAALTGDVFLTQKDDMTGNGNHVAQAVEALQPKWLPAASNNFSTPALDFDGSDDYLANGTGIVLTAFSVMAVFEADVIPGVAYGILVQTNSAPNPRAMMAVHASEIMASTTNAGGAKSGAASTATKYVAQYTYAAGTGALQLNNSALTGTNAPANSAAGLFFGGYPFNAFNGRIVAGGIKNAAWSDADRNALALYASEIYGFPLA